MTVTVSCECGAQTVVDRHSVDRVYICSSCRRPLKVPSPPSPPDPPPAPAGRPDPASAPTPPGSQRMVCPCGENLLVRQEFVGKEVVCGSCKRVFKLEAVRDPQTKVTFIKATVVGEMWKLPRPTAQEKWSLEDFK